MNIDTSNLSANTESATYLTSANSRKIHGGNTFSSQLKTLQSVSDSEGNNIEENISDETFAKDDNTTDMKSEQKVENKTTEQETNSQNEQNPQAGQASSEQQNSNKQSSDLSDEILAVMKANGKAGVDGLNNFRLVSGISEDVYSSAPKINYASFSMSDGDALFFANLVMKTDMSMQNIAGEFQKSLATAKVEQVQKTAQVSSVLIEALTESMKTNKAFRIDFDKDISVILRVDRDGNLNANFIPGDKAVEAYLRNNIGFLKQRFDEENLSYGELTYSRHKRQEQDEEKQNNKENSHE